MEYLFPALFMLIATGVGVRVWLKRIREERIAARRRVEAPNSHYSSVGVKHREDRERWERIDLSSLHPLNQDEVQRLLAVVDSEGVGVLSERERVFLDNMTEHRAGE